MSARIGSEMEFVRAIEQYATHIQRMGHPFRAAFTAVSGKTVVSLWSGNGLVRWQVSPANALAFCCGYSDALDVIKERERKAAGNE